MSTDTVSTLLSVFTPEGAFLRVALVGVLLVSFVSGLLSPSVVIKQRSFWGDALGHLLFPGLVVGIVSSEFFGAPQWLGLFLGASTTALCGTFGLESLERLLKIPADAAGVVLLTFFFSCGLIFSQSFLEGGFDLHTFLLGDPLSLVWSDLIPLCLTALVSFWVFVYFRRDFDAWLADEEFAKIVGFRVALVRRLFPVLLTSAVLSGIFTVGSLLFSALLTVPAVLTPPRSSFSVRTLAVALGIGLAGFALSVLGDFPMGASLVLVGGVLVLSKAIVVRASAH
jgi:ABC-type Mn2+/Zn2+ transport system permease subunit